MAEGESLFNPLLLVVAVAFIVPFITTRIPKIRLPIVVGEILAGIVLGESGLGWITGNEWLDFLSLFGFAYLMFLSGLEVNVEVLLHSVGGDTPRWYRHPVTLGVMIFLLTLAGSYGVSLLLVGTGLVQSPYLMTLILSTTSLAVVMPVLKEREMTGSLFGQTLIAAAVIADFGTMLLITLVVALLTGGLGFELLLILLLFVALFFFYRILKRLQRLRIIEELQHATAQIGVRGSLALMLVFVALAQGVGTEIILGAFLAGFTISLVEGAEGSSLRRKLDAIGYGFFIPVFFIMVGARFDFSALTENPAAASVLPIMLLAAFPLKMVPALVLRLVYPWRRVLGAGVLLGARLSLIIAAADIGLRLGVIGEAINAAVILVAVTTTTLAPVLFDWIMPSGAAEERRRGVMVVGATRTAILLAQRLKGHDEEVRLVDKDPERVAAVRETSLEAIEADAVTEAGLKRAGIDRVRILVALTGDDATNLLVCRLGRSLGVERAIARVTTSDWLQRAREAGVEAVTPEVSTLIMLDNLVRHPSSLTLLTEEDLCIEDVPFLNPYLPEGRLQDFPLSQEVLVVAITRDDTRLIPHGGTFLQHGDILTFVGPQEDCQAMRELFAGWPLQGASPEPDKGGTT